MIMIMMRPCQRSILTLSIKDVQRQLAICGILRWSNIPGPRDDEMKNLCFAGSNPADLTYPVRRTLAIEASERVPGNPRPV